MNFDKWFAKQDKLIKVILLIIPFVGWLCEILIRLSALIRKQSNINIIGFILFLITGLIVTYADLIWLIVKNENILID